MKANADQRRIEKQTRLPDFLYIGTSKAGSTWIYKVLAAHPAVYIAPGKGTYFFDQHFDRGMDWYIEQFRRAEPEEKAGEISHSYLSSAEAAVRIAEFLPAVKLLVCLREPVERAFSAYLDSVKNGRFEGSFESALEANPSLLARGAYAQQLRRYLDIFPRTQLHIAVFDDLKSDPQRFSDELCNFLGLDRRPLGAADRQKMMPAAVPRSRRLTSYIKQLARSADKVGMRGLRGRVKRSRLIRNLLYRPLGTDELPRMRAETREKCRDSFRSQVKELDAMLGLQLQERWKY